MSQEFKPLTGLLRSALACIAAGVLLLLFSLETFEFRNLSIFQFVPGILSLLYRTTGKFKLFALLFYSFGLLIWAQIIFTVATRDTFKAPQTQMLGYMAMAVCVPTLLAGTYFVITTKRADVTSQE